MLESDNYNKGSLEYELLRAITDYRISGELRAACEEWIAIQARFNTWFIDVPKRNYTDQRLLDVLEVGGKAYEEISEAWRNYDAQPSSDHQDALMRAFTRSRDFSLSMMAGST
jgi:hypothetical protein